jgi:hypothetical protein
MANDFFKSSNPTLSDKTFDQFDSRAIQNPAERMTIDGTVNKTALVVGFIGGIGKRNLVFR